MAKHMNMVWDPFGGRPWAPSKSGAGVVSQYYSFVMIRDCQNRLQKVFNRGLCFCAGGEA